MKPTTRRRLTQGGLYALLAGAAVALGLLADWGSIQETFFDWGVIKSQFPEVITIGAKNTVVLT